MLEPQTCQYILGVSPPGPEAEGSFALVLLRLERGEKRTTASSVFLSARWNLPSYAEFWTLQTSTAFCRSPADSNRETATAREGPGEDRTDGDGPRSETEGIRYRTQFWSAEEQRRPARRKEGGDVAELNV